MVSILAQSEESKAFVKELCFEFVHEAASLWLLRCKAVCAPHYTLTDLLELDNRLEAQIDALRVAGDPGWEMCETQTGRGRPEHFFSAAILAFESCDEKRITDILDAAGKTPAVSEGIISALGWLTYGQAEPHIKKLLLSKSAVHQYIGIAASAFHRQDPGSRLENAFYSPDATLKARSLKAVGELGGRGDKLMPGRLNEQLKSEQAECRFRSAWSLALLGDVSALDLLKPLAMDSPSPFRKEALQLALRRMDIKEALGFHQEMTKKSDANRLAVMGAGSIGDTALIPWLINQMSMPALARVAGEAFTLITGVNISEQELEGSWPEGFEAGPNDDPKDSNVALDPDENLPWPDTQKISAWWDKNKTQFKTGDRYLLGKPITQDHLQTVLQTGLQRQRTAAALELALIEPGKPLFNTAAPAWRQMPDIKPQPCTAIGPNYGSRPLAITAVNCITPLGHNAVMTAASVRAGITRFRICEDYRDQNGNPITIARIRGLKDDIQNAIERIREIAEICLDDLLNEYLSPSGGASPANNLKVTSAGGKQGVRPSEVHFMLGVASNGRPGPDYGEETMIVLKHVIAEYFGKYTPEILPQGSASLHNAIRQAAKLIAGQPEMVCIIGCIDCLLRESILDGFESAGRLKSARYGRHHGLIPSEAASFLVVEDYDRAIGAGRTVLARITALGLGDEPHPRASDKTGICKGLTETCNAALDPFKDRKIQAVFGDLNGENDRAQEWGVVRMRSFEKDAKQPALWSPADTYGDVAAACGAVMAGIVAQGFARNWLSSPVMIFCSDDSGPCGAVILEKHE